MQLIDRDKKLLLVLGIILIAFLFYNFFFKVYSERLDNLLAQKQQLENKLNEMNQRIAMYLKNKKEQEKIEKLYADYSKLLPPNQDEKFSMVDLQRLAKEIGVKEPAAYNVSARQNVTSNGSNNFTGVFYYSFNQSWQMTYEQLKKILTHQKKYTPLYSINSIVITNNSDKKEQLNVSFEIRFYGFVDDLAEKRQWFDFNIPTAKPDLFK